MPLQTEWKQQLQKQTETTQQNHLNVHTISKFFRNKLLSANLVMYPLIEDNLAMHLQLHKISYM